MTQEPKFRICKTETSHLIHSFTQQFLLHASCIPNIMAIVVALSTLGILQLSMGFPGGSEGKASACNAGDLGSIPGSGRSPGEGNGNTLQYSCLENPMDREAWWITVHGISKSRTRLSDFTHYGGSQVVLTRQCRIQETRVQSLG